jgi:hypothetical protein
MTRRTIFSTVFFFLILAGLPQFMAHASTASDDVHINLSVDAICNNNNICEAGLGENTSNCPNDCTPPPPSTGNGGGGSHTPADIFFTNLIVTTTTNSATITWTSTNPTLSILRWGRTAEYGDGTSNSIFYLRDHRTEINNLENGTAYYFTIESRNFSGRVQSTSGTFLTVRAPDTSAPANPTSVRAISKSNGIELSWINPRDKDFDYVRIMRDEARFNSSPHVGALVYEGRASHFLDPDVLIGTKYFYTLFSYDKLGNNSSGSGVSIIFDPNNSVPVPVPEVTTPVPSSDLVDLIPLIFNVSQNGTTITFKKGDTVRLSGDVPVIVFTSPYDQEELQQKIDDLLIEIKDRNGEISGNYFFKRRNDLNQYEVEVPPLGEVGDYRVAIYGYKGTESMRLLEGTFSSVSYNKEMNSHATEIPVVDSLLSAIILFFLLMLILLFLSIKKHK